MPKPKKVRFIWQTGKKPETTLLPKPHSLQRLPGRPLVLTQCAVESLGVTDSRPIDFLKEGLARFGVKIKKSPIKIRLIQEKSAPGVSPESYSLTIGPSASKNQAGVEIRSGSAQGVFRGVTTFLQLAEEGPRPRFKPVRIMDKPDLSLRGFSIDFRYAWLSEEQV